MAASWPNSLKSIPLVRRFEYLDVYLEGVENGLNKVEIEEALGRRKKEFEFEKNVALGRGNLQREDIVQAVYLLRYCFRLSRDLKFIDKEGQIPRLLEKGKRFLHNSGEEKLRLFAEAYSTAYPHLTVLILALARLKDNIAVLPLMNKPEFKHESEKIGIGMSQVIFDTVRDVATILGLVNWYVDGVGIMRRQHVYLTCRLSEAQHEPFLVKIRSGESWLYALSFIVDRSIFRETLWDIYLALADGVPGSPVFFSTVRERVCAELRLRDDQFDFEVLDMVETDNVLHVILSEGTLDYRHDTASMLKSLPPKNEWGEYVVYLKIIKR